MKDKHSFSDHDIDPGYILKNLPGHLYWKDVEGRFLGCNEEQAKTLGLTSPEEIIGKIDSDFISIEDADFIRKIDKEVIRKKCAITIEEPVYNDEEKRTIYYLSKKSPLFDCDGKVIGIIGISIDASVKKNELKKYIRQKNQSEVALNTIISLLPGHVYWKDKDGIFLGCNKSQAESVGYNSPNELIGKTAYETLPEHQANKITEADNELMRTGRPIFIEEISDSVKGKSLTYLSRKVPLRNKNNEIIGILGLSLDISDRKKLEENLQKAKEKAEAASQAKSEFIANMSHDIRTPITGMLGMIQDLLNTADRTESYLKTESSQASSSLDDSSLLKKMIETVQRDGEFLMGATDELLQLCNEILEVTRLEKGVLCEDPESFELGEMVRHNLELLQPVAQHKKLDFSVHIDEAVPRYFHGLRSYLDRTLLNLMSNALKFTETGFVKVSIVLLEKAKTTHQKGDQITLRIVVEDSGIGIPDDHFSRLTPSYQGIYKGSGLGLYTVKRYVDAMKGTIKVTSHINKGSSFIVTLPLTVSDCADRQRQSIRPQSSLKRATALPPVQKKRETHW